MSGGARMIQWTTNASAYRGKIGKRLVLGCPAHGQHSSVWGTGIYTDDSSICTAAAHSGLLTVARGGIVTVEIAVRKPSYVGSTQNGVASGSWGQYGGSFHFIGSARALPTRPRLRLKGAKTIPWNQTARHLRAQVGKRFTFYCPSAGRVYTVWGSSIYTDDSSICSAAVHAGYITVTRGGRVTVELQSGQAAYQGSTRNGVKTASWRNWSGSFIFLNPIP